MEDEEEDDEEAEEGAQHAALIKSRHLTWQVGKKHTRNHNKISSLKLNQSSASIKLDTMFNVQ